MPEITHQINEGIKKTRRCSKSMDVEIILKVIDNNDEININPPKKIMNIIIIDFELFFLLSIMAQLTQIPIFSSKPPSTSS
jgi:hypothetical protein